MQSSASAATNNSCSSGCRNSSRLLGPPTYQEEFLHPLEQELFVAAEADDCMQKGLPLFIKTLQQWLRNSRRLVEVSSGRTVIDCAFVKVDSEDVVEKVLTWGRICT